MTFFSSMVSAQMAHFGSAALAFRFFDMSRTPNKQRYNFWFPLFARSRLTVLQRRTKMAAYSTLSGKGYLASSAASSFSKVWR